MYLAQLVRIRKNFFQALKIPPGKQHGEEKKAKIKVQGKGPQSTDRMPMSIM